MSYLPQDLQDNLDAARVAGLKKMSRLKVRTDETVVKVLRSWKTGFAVDLADAAHLRGLVDMYDGERHLFTCLIVAAEAEGGEMQFEYKRSTAAKDSAPLDFHRETPAPLAYLT